MTMQECCRFCLFAFLKHPVSSTAYNNLTLIPDSKYNTINKVSLLIGLNTNQSRDLVGHAQQHSVQQRGGGKIRNVCKICSL